MRIYYLLSFLLVTAVAFSQERRETISVEKFSLNFRTNKVDLDPSYLSNSTTLHAIEKSIKESADCLFYINIEVYSSPDGPVELNNSLSAKRATAIEKYPNETFGLKKSEFIAIKSLGENWNDLYELISADSQMPQREKVLKLLSDKSLDKTTLEIRLRNIDKGIPFSYIRKNFLDKLRMATFRVEKSRIVPDTVAQVPAIVEAPRIEQPSPEPVPAPAIKPVTPGKRFPFLIKTNLAAYAVAVANLGVEFRVGKQLSIDLPFYYSPYTVANDYRFRIMAIQPELRYWLKNPLKGHFLGTNLLCGYFNVATNGEDRYQDRDGNTPAIGVGLSYGFALPLSKDWGVEFGAGIGYLRLDYDRFYNVKDGIKTDSSTKHYFGPTKFNINLIYKLH